MLTSLRPIQLCHVVRHCLLCSRRSQAKILHPSNQIAMATKFYATTKDPTMDPSNTAHLEILADAKQVTHTSTKSVVPGKGPPPELPVYCCMSGCDNCVWLVYADELLKYYSGMGGPEVIKAIHEHVHDANLKAYLLLELKMKGIK